MLIFQFPVTQFEVSLFSWEIKNGKTWFPAKKRANSSFNLAFIHGGFKHGLLETADKTICRFQDVSILSIYIGAADKIIDSTNLCMAVS